ncbi:hypothetical protein ABW20_dc0100999 [Dactylellina cionopaga]|nr:hypothetical protein ABW20_dc0100999 [Dactylellina cionopaga]
MSNELLEMDSVAPPAPLFTPKKPITSQILRVVVLIISLPYHRFFLYNTLRPTEVVEKFAPYGTENGSPYREKVCNLLKNWRARKKAELEFVSLAELTITALVTATLSWGTIANSHYIGPAFFYTSLILSIIGMLLSAQQLTLLTLLGEFPEDGRRLKRKFIEGYLHQLLTEDEDNKHDDVERHNNQVTERRYKVRYWRLSWQMVFVWQIPMMAVGYSFLAYIIGLTVLICTPLIREPWGDNSKIAIFYLAFSGLSWGIFIYCSLCGYRNVSLDNKNDEEDDEEDEEDGQENETSSSKNAKRNPLLQNEQKTA